MKNEYDVVIIGGGPAGLTAALTLGRGARNVLVIDEGKGRNAPASHMMNFPSRDGTPPNEFREQIRSDLKKYSNVHLMSGKVTSLVKAQKVFRVNETITAKKILLAHGVKDVLPDIPGIKELWGKSIFHCPYCHGYEHRNHPIGLVMGQEIASHMAPIVKGLTSDLILFTNGELVEDPSLFEKNGIQVYHERIKRFHHTGEKLNAVELDNGKVIEREFLFMKPKQEMTTDLALKLGCELNQFGLYKVDENGLTTVDGIYAAGDIAEPRQSVLLASASATKTAAVVNYALLHEDFIAI